MKKLFFLLLSVNCLTQVNSQVKIGTNPSVVNSFSLLELEGSGKGLLLPRISTATELALMSGAPEGMIVYFVPEATLFIKQSAAWVKLTGNWATAGTHIYNENGGNVGIGTSNPVHAKLEVDGFVGNAAGMFGNSTNSGISLNVGFPEVGFNYYFNGANKAIAPGYAAVVGLNPLTGDLYFGNFNNNQAPTPFTDIPGYADRFILKQNGNVNFKKSVDITEKLTSPRSGSANLLPLAYGKIRSDGVILGGTGNFSATKTGTGIYEITLIGESGVYANRSIYMVQATVESSIARLVSVDFQVNNNIQIRTAQPKVNYTNAFCSSCSDVYSYITSFSASQDEDNTFSFIIYKF